MKSSQWIPFTSKWRMMIRYSVVKTGIPELNNKMITFYNEEI